MVKVVNMLTTFTISIPPTSPYVRLSGYPCASRDTIIFLQLIKITLAYLGQAVRMLRDISSRGFFPTERWQ